MTRSNDNRTPPNPSGLCLCGCGETTTVARYNDITSERVRGEHVRFIPGHQNRLTTPAYTVEDRGYKTPCHVWLRHIMADGYGTTKFKGRDCLAHIAAWEEVNGPVPDGLQLDHLCRVRACRNPEHLEAVPQMVNAQRGLAAKFTPNDIQRIREIGRGIPGKEIAKAYGVTPAAISKILLRRTWKNVA